MISEQDSKLGLLDAWNAILYWSITDIQVEYCVFNAIGKLARDVLTCSFLSHQQSGQVRIEVY